MVKKMSFAQIALEGERVEEEGLLQQNEEVVEVNAPDADEERREQRFNEMEASYDEVADVEDTVTADTPAESEDGEPTEPTEPEGDAPAELPETTSVEDDYDARQSEEFAIESINFYGELLRHQIETKTVSMESIQLIQFGVQQVYASQGIRLRTIATESAMTPEAYGRYVLEHLALEAEHGDSSFLKRVGNVLGTLVGKAESTYKYYEQHIEDTRREYEEKAQLMNGPIQMNMAGGVDNRWHFFSTDRGQSAHLVQDLQKDVQLSTYIMFDYAPKAIEALNKIVEAIGHLQPHDEEGMKQALLQIEKLPTPMDLFNQQYITGKKKPYFGVTGVDVKVGAQRKVLQIGGVAFQKLAEMASPKYVYETSSFGHGVKKFFNVTLQNKRTVIQPADVKALLDAAEGYNKAIGQSVQILKGSEQAIHKAMVAVLDVHKANWGFIGSNSTKGQLLAVIDAAAMAIYTIVRDEQKRAMAGAMHSLWAVMYSIDGLVKQGGKGVTKV